MNYDDRILFESYFRMIKESETINNNDLFFVINIILNSKEFLDSEVKISNKIQESTLVSLTINQKKGKTSYFTFYATYFVSDSELIENRDIIGSIKIHKGKVYLVSNIHRYCENDYLKDFELGEIFELDSSNSYRRVSSYNFSSVIDSISIPVVNFDRVNKFREETIKLIKEKKRG